MMPNETFNAAKFQLLTRIKAGASPYPIDPAAVGNVAYEFDLSEALEGKWIEKDGGGCFKLTDVGDAELAGMKSRT